MNIQALCHIPNSNYAYAYNLNTIHIRLRTARDDMSKVEICYGSKFNWTNKKTIPMRKVLSDEYFDYYLCELKPDDSRVGYYFELTDNEGLFKIFCEVGMLDEFDDDLGYCLYYQYPFLNPSDIHVVPDWVDDTVFYQIFIERFFNGNPDNSPEELEEWNAEPTPKSFFGGDLEGIIKKIDYLDELGINAIYLTPVFQSISNHKYDISDYMKIDNYFGDKDTLTRLVNKAHDKGMKVILDAVFNHCSMNISFFQDVLKNGSESPYKDWFIINSFPVSLKEKNYETFGFCNYMPKLNCENEEVRKYLFSVVEYWTKETNIDGWRLDVADEVSRNFWRDFRKVVKNMDENLIIIGESWHIALDWLRGDMYDSVMNYPVTKLMLDYYAKKDIDAKQFEQRLSTHFIQYSLQVNKAMLNLLDSHDTERYLTTCKGNKNSLIAATMFLYGYVGMPCTYYGTEIGMDGGYDPGCRKGFDWNQDNWDMKVFNLYKKVIDIRKKEDALKHGDMAFYEEDAFVMERRYNNEIIYIVSNTTDKAVKVDLQKILRDSTGIKTEKNVAFDELIANECSISEDTAIVEIMPDGSGYYKIII